MNSNIISIFYIFGSLQVLSMFTGPKNLFWMIIHVFWLKLVEHEYCAFFNKTARKTADIYRKLLFLDILHELQTIICSYISWVAMEELLHKNCITFIKSWSLLSSSSVYALVWTFSHFAGVHTTESLIMPLKVFYMNVDSGLMDTPAFVIGIL